MKVFVQIEKEIDVDVSTSDFISELNLTPVAKRWSHIASILNEVILSKEGLEDRQRLVIEEWLNKKLKEVRLPEAGNVESKDHFAQSQMEYHGTTN